MQEFFTKFPSSIRPVFFIDKKWCLVSPNPLGIVQVGGANKWGYSQLYIAHLNTSLPVKFQHILVKDYAHQIAVCAYKVTRRQALMKVGFSNFYQSKPFAIIAQESLKIFLTRLLNMFGNILAHNLDRHIQ